jgi:hypothetical protein
LNFIASKPRHHNKLTIAEPMVTSTIVEMPIDGLKAPLIYVSTVILLFLYDSLGSFNLRPADDLYCQYSHEAIDSILAFWCDTACQPKDDENAFLLT